MVRLKQSQTELNEGEDIVLSDTESCIATYYGIIYYAEVYTDGVKIGFF